LAGELERAEMIRLFKRDTRRFAKRQMTWFRRESQTNWLMIGESESLEQTVGRAMQLIAPFLLGLDANEAGTA
jgi:tRNA dimethylallyltransferase